MILNPIKENKFFNPIKENKDLDAPAQIYSIFGQVFCKYRLNQEELFPS